MKKAFPSMLFLLALAAPALAASSTDFYMTLLRRGTADVEAGRYAEATGNLRLAAFGLLESIEHYEIAQAYLTVAFDRLGQPDQARDAAQRILAAEKVERKFRSIALPAAIRTAFDAVARKLLSATDAAALSGGATAKPSEPVVVDRVDVITETPRTQPPAPAPATTPQTTPQNPPRTAPDAGAAPQTTRPETTQPQTRQPQTTPPRTQPQTTQPQTTQPQTTPPQTTPPRTTQPQTTPPQTRQPQTTPQNPPPGGAAATPAPGTARPPTPAAGAAPRETPRTPRPVDIPGQFAAAERALTSANITEARRIYRELLALPNLDRAALIRLAEGFYRSRDFANALTAFERAGALRAGEEPYRYYMAVAAYELGQYDRARRELAAALPYIELTPDVQRYRTKIEAAR